MTDLGNRTLYIGGSDAGSILGVNKWCSPMDLYLQKIGEGEKFEGNRFTEWGTALEEPIAKHITKHYRIKLRRDNKLYKHPEHPYILGHIDRQVQGENAIAEIKTARFASDEWGEEGTDEVPKSYLCQVQHYLGLTKADYCLLFVLFGDKDFKMYKIHRHEDLIAEIFRQEVNFWENHVLKHVPPAPRTPEDVAKLYPEENLDLAAADAEALELIGQIKNVNARIKTDTEVVEGLKTSLKAIIGGHSGLSNGEGEIIATWKLTERKGYEVKPTSFRKLNIKK
jgi:putative phage-type endonuclease